MPNILARRAFLPPRLSAYGFAPNARPAQKPGKATGQGYNDGVPGHTVSINPFPLLIVVAGILIVIFVLIARRHM